jgi:hypothetical protein
MNAPAIREFQRVRIGRHEFPFTTCEAVSRAYRGTIERLGIGGSETPPCEILNHRGEIVGNVSYNGRVWLGDLRSWEPGKSPIFDPNGFLGDWQDACLEKRA